MLYHEGAAGRRRTEHLEHVRQAEILQGSADSAEATAVTGFAERLEPGGRVFGSGPDLRGGRVARRRRRVAALAARVQGVGRAATGACHWRHH